MKNNKNDWSTKKILTLFLIMCLIAKLIFDFSGFWANIGLVFKYLGYILSYLIFGLSIAYILNAYIDVWENNILKKVLNKKKKLKKAICIIIGYLSFLGVISFLIFALVPTLTRTVNDLISKIPSLINDGVAFYSSVLDGTKYEIPPDVLASIGQAMDSLLDSILGFFDISFIANILTSTTTWILNIVMGLIVSIYMLIDKERNLRALNRTIDALLPENAASKLRWAGNEINKILRKYFTGKLLQALVFTFMTYAAFSIAGIPYAILFAIIAGITNMIPYVGPWIGAIPVTFVSLVYNFWLGLIAIVCILICQAIDNWLVAPRIVGGQMGISPLLVLAGLTIGGKAFGLIGLLFGDILAAIFKVFFYDNFVKKRLEKKQLT